MSGCPSMGLIIALEWILDDTYFAVFNYCLNIAWYDSLPSSFVHVQISHSGRSQHRSSHALLWLPAGQGGKLKSTCWGNWTGFGDLYGFVTNTLLTLYLQIHGNHFYKHIAIYWDVIEVDSTRLKFQKEVGMSNYQGWYHETWGAFEGCEFCMDLHGFGGWCHGTATCSQGLASDRSLVNRMQCLLQTLTGNLLGCWFWLQDRIFVYQSDQRETSFFSVSNSWCVHPRMHCTSLSSSATRLGDWDISYLLSWVLGSTPYSALFHGFPIWFHWFHCACWLVSLRWFDIIWCHALHFWMLRLEGTSGKRFLVQYSSKVWIFKLIVEVRKLTSRLTFFLIHDHGHLRVWLDMMFHDRTKFRVFHESS